MRNRQNNAQRSKQANVQTRPAVHEGPAPAPSAPYKQGTAALNTSKMDGGRVFRSDLCSDTAAHPHKRRYECTCMSRPRDRTLSSCNGHTASGDPAPVQKPRPEMPECKQGWETAHCKGLRSLYTFLLQFILYSSYQLSRPARLRIQASYNRMPSALICYYLQGQVQT